MAIDDHDRRPSALPSDDHVHSEFSWDAESGSMDRTCARAVELGVPSVAFTEHADFTPWVVPPGTELPGDWEHLRRGHLLVPPHLDLVGYLASLDRCRERYPSLRIVAGVELSEPHLHPEQVGALLRSTDFERVLASVHSAPTGVEGELTELSSRYAKVDPRAVVREFLAETVRLVTDCDDFHVLAHIDYPVRYWPAGGITYDPRDFEDDYRAVLDALAASGRALEVNTRRPLDPIVLSWWRDEGGDAITFASDAHEPGLLAHGFREAVAVAEAAGFRPGRDPHDFWGRA